MNVNNPTSAVDMQLLHLVTVLIRLLEMGGGDEDWHKTGVPLDFCCWHSFQAFFCFHYNCWKPFFLFVCSIFLRIFRPHTKKFIFSCRFWKNAQENNWSIGKLTFLCWFWKNAQENNQIHKKYVFYVG